MENDNISNRALSERKAEPKERQELKPCLLCLEVVQSIYQSLKSFEAGLLLTNVDGQICKDDAS